MRGMWLATVVTEGQAARRHRVGCGRGGFFSYKVVLGGLCELLLGSISKIRVCEVVSRSVLGGRIAS